MFLGQDDPLQQLPGKNGAAPVRTSIQDGSSPVLCNSVNDLACTSASRSRVNSKREAATSRRLRWRGRDGASVEASTAEASDTGSSERTAIASLASREIPATSPRRHLRTKAPGDRRSRSEVPRHLSFLGTFDEVATSCRRAPSARLGLSGLRTTFLRPN